MVRRFIATAFPYVGDSSRTSGMERAFFLVPYFMIHDFTEKRPLVKTPDSSAFSFGKRDYQENSVGIRLFASPLG